MHQLDEASKEVTCHRELGTHIGNCIHHLTEHCFPWANSASEQLEKYQCQATHSIIK